MPEIKFTFDDAVMEEHPEIIDAISAWVKRQIPEATIELDGVVQDGSVDEKKWKDEEAAAVEEEAIMKKEKEKETKTFAQRVDERIAKYSAADARFSDISPYNTAKLYKKMNDEATMEIISEDLEKEVKSYKEGKQVSREYTY